jgi:hypothetical protein
VVVPSRAQLAGMSDRDAEALARGVMACEKGDGVEMTVAEVREYARTGRLPERIERWFASRGC